MEGVTTGGKDVTGRGFLEFLKDLNSLLFKDDIDCETDGMTIEGLLSTAGTVSSDFSSGLTLILGTAILTDDADNDVGSFISGWFPPFTALVSNIGRMQRSRTDVIMFGVKSE